MSDTKLLETARERFKLVTSVETNQREREREDLRFQDPELQWDEAARKERKGRPTLAITQIDQPLRLIVNQMRSADLGVQISPVSEDANEDTAQMLQDKYREIERESRAELARAWAFDRAVKAGRGYYRVLHEYDEYGGHPSDQKITIKRILHQDGVYFDPAAQEPDYSDAEYCFLVAWMPKAEFERQYGGKDAKNKLEWEQMAAEAPEWVQDGDVAVCEYFWKEHAEKDGRDVVSVKWAKLSAWAKLDEEEWPGKYIPVIPVIGRELQPFDSERRYFGLIRPARDGQQLVNFSASNFVESMNLEPKVPYVGYPETIEGYEKYWAEANVRNLSFLPIRPAHDEKGNLLPPPQRSQIDSSRMSLAMMGLQQGKDMVQMTTAIFDPSLGNVPQKDRSGRAILALQQQSDAGTSDYLQNLADISMTYEARVVLDLIPKIYDRPQRVTRIVRGDDRKTAPVMLGAPFTIDKQTKRPIPAKVDPGVPLPQGVKHYDLTRGGYDVAVTIGKSFQTRLQEGSEKIGEFLTQAKDPRIALALLPLYLRFQDFPGAPEMADVMEKLREGAMPGLVQSEDGQPTVAQLQGKIQQMEQAGQALQQQLEQAAQMLKTKQPEIEARVQIAEIERDTRLRVAAADSETKLAIAGIKAQMDEVLSVLRLQAEAQKLRASQEHDVVMGELGRPAPEPPAGEERA